MAREKDPRITNAFIAMRSIGIPSEKVKPVLKRLLTLYGRRWELIEENNYSTLADAIFEYENEKPKNDVNGSIVNDNMETQFKKSDGAQLQDEASSQRVSGSRRLDLQEGSGQELKDFSQSLSRNPKDDNTPLSHQAFVRDREGLPTATSQASMGENLLNERESNHLCTDGINEPSFLHKGREKIQVDHRDGNVTQRKRKELGSVVQHGTPTPSNVYPDKGKRVDGSACHDGASLQSTFDLASSTCGKVKISLTCENHDLGQPNSQSLNLDAVVKHAEDKHLRCKIVGPKFSLMQLLKELCDSYLELACNSAFRFLIKESSGDSPNKIMGTNQESVIRDSRGTDMKKRIRSSASSNSICLAVDQKLPVSNEKRIALRKIHDITNDTEKVSISLLDEIGNENLPDFVYIPQNIVYQSAYVQVSLARISDEDCCASCAGNCLSSSFPCACARETGGEFAYTPEGLLKEEFLDACISMNEEPQKHYHFYCPDCPLERAKNARRPQKCKGHLVRKFAKECWRKCRCSMQCGNRVVQRGITRKLQVSMTAEGKGWGVRTLEALPKGAFVCEYVGEILTNIELYERNKQSSNKDRHTYPVLLDADWGSEGVLKDEDALCLDATYYGNIGRFINHRCFDSNLIDIPVEVETPDHHYYRLAFFTKRKVNALEELTWDYGIDFNDRNHPVEAFECCCGSAYCRDVKGKSTKPNKSN